MHWMYINVFFIFLNTCYIYNVTLLCFIYSVENVTGEVTYFIDTKSKKNSKMSNDGNKL